MNRNMSSSTPAIRWLYPGVAHRTKIWVMSSSKTKPSFGPGELFSRPTMNTRYGSAGNTATAWWKSSTVTTLKWCWLPWVRCRVMQGLLLNRCVRQASVSVWLESARSGLSLRLILLNFHVRSKLSPSWTAVFPAAWAKDPALPKSNPPSITWKGKRRASLVLSPGCTALRFSSPILNIWPTRL